ncbi:hypothetical protein [Streptomyces tropicalis]|uniref:Uncharacterized protein n=1 Tax=Streptomyces tropicalis TaxID=3034234 RepID=A0ABT6A2B7_9ACTN|nr:hypothetical protein [Streptomyces tropicalis]MDF3298612.1 hypothetical protein [Streptomyces tropicalis]
MVYNIAQLSYRQSVTPPEMMGRTNAAVRWVVWGTLPIGGVLGGLLGTLIGVRPALRLAFVGSWAAGWFVFFSPSAACATSPDPRPRPHPSSGADGRRGSEADVFHGTATGATIPPRRRP